MSQDFDIISLINLAHLWGFDLVGVSGNMIIMKRISDDTLWRGQPQSCERWTAAFKYWSESPTVTYNGHTIPDP
jgi:hypothetical protein